MEESGDEGDQWVVSIPKSDVNGEQKGGLNVEMFPSGLHHGDEGRASGMGNMVAANDDRGNLVARVPSHDGGREVAHDAPMACHGHLGVSTLADKEIAARSLW